MSKNWFLREKYVIIHGQPREFRIKKYILLIIISSLAYYLKGWKGVGYLILTAAVLGTIGHFFLRWKTKGWRKSWKFVKRIKTPYD